MPHAIEFFTEEVDFSLEKEDLLTEWIVGVIRDFGGDLGEISFIFCSDEYLLGLNQSHLDHDYYTDILTFPLHEEGHPIIADIFISVDRVRDNAIQFGIPMTDELYRVMIHGILHLLGFDDHQSEDITAIRAAEDKALAQVKALLAASDN